MSIQIIKDRVIDTVGFLAIGHATIANFTEWILGLNWNAVALFITTTLSIIYLIYHIRETLKTNELRRLEIERERLNIEKMKAEIKNINSNIDVNSLKSINNKIKNQ